MELPLQDSLTQSLATQVRPFCLICAALRGLIISDHVDRNTLLNPKRTCESPGYLVLLPVSHRSVLSSVLTLF